MSVIDDFTKSIDATPVYAMVGATNLVLEKTREAGSALVKVGDDVTAAADKVRSDVESGVVQERATKLAESVLEFPQYLVHQGQIVGEKAIEGYHDLAVRGQKILNRIENAPATQNFVEQAETAVAQAKGAATSARRAAADIERSAKATVTTTRKEAAKVADAVSTSVENVAETVAKSVDAEVKATEKAVEASAKRTRTAAKRTSTTAKNATKRSNTKAKAARTSVRKTAAAAAKATEKAAETIA